MTRPGTPPDHAGADSRRSALVRWATSPTGLTVGLTATLLTVGALLASQVPPTSVLAVPAGTPTTVVVGALVVLFFLTELGQARIEVRRQAYSFSLSGVPLLLGLLYCPPVLLIAARLLAAVVAFAVQRVPPVKLAFNTASYLLDVSAVVVLTHLLVGDRQGLGIAIALLCYLGLAVVDLLMSAVVLLVIRINGGPVGREDVGEVLLSAGVFVALNTATGLICALLLTSGSLGVVLLAGVAAVAALSYRAYLVLRRRHRSLQDLQDFIRLGEGVATAEGLGRRMLPQVAALLRAGRAELSVLDPDGAHRTVLTVGEGGEAEVTRAPVLPERRTADAGAGGGAAGAGDRPAVAASSAGARSGRRGGHASLTVGLDGSGARGTLTVADRLGDRTRFTDDDLALLETLAGHFAVALLSVQLVERLRYDATHDILTGLPNRALLSERIGTLMAGAPADGAVGVLVLDLDRFKDVNDAFGHHVGDDLLRVVARRLVEVVPAGCTVSRLGGDEFAVLLPPSTEPERAARDLADGIRAALARPVHLADAAVTIDACVGVAVAAAGQDHADVLRHADTAMYAAKDARLPVVVHSDHLDEGRRERLALLVDLRGALDRDELQLHYQPKIHLASGVATSVEALVRWTHPTLGPVSPEVFVPLAESTGLIDELTQAVLLVALRQCRQWRDAGHDLAVAVNLSARNVNDVRLPERVAAALALTGVPAHRLILEITESSIMGAPERTVPTLERLAALGVTLSLDDFGTGYSSLSYLQRLPVRELKIDRSFLLGLERPDDAAASEVLVRSIIDLGQSLGLSVVAEGVETAEILERLRALGCDLVQGYLVSRAVPAPAVTAAVERAGYRTARAGVLPTPHRPQAASPAPRPASHPQAPRVSR